MSSPYISSTQVASSVPYDNSVSGVSETDTQAVIDYILSQVTSGPAGLATSSSTRSAISTTTPTAMNGMVITPVTPGNYAVSFTGQFTGTTNVQIWIYVGTTQYPNSLRTQTGPAGSHNFVMATGEKVTVTSGQSIYVYWASTSCTVTGRNISAIKVT